MIELECPDRGGYEYAKFLLHDKQRELRYLKLKHSRRLISSQDYDSCRRSLLQGIKQLKTLLRSEPKPLNDSGECSATVKMV